MTGQAAFDSHIFRLVDVAARLVNGLTGSYEGGREFQAQPSLAVAGALELAAVGEADVKTLTEAAFTMRSVFEAVAEDDLGSAAVAVNALMAGAGARPQLDPLADGGWHVHFHGRDDTLAVGWVAGCATGLALAIGSGLAGRLGVCAADRCDRVFVDVSRNAGKRFCSLTCQNRTKAAAFRGRG